MSVSFESILSAALQLGTEDRCRVAASLWESVGAPLPGLDDSDLEAMLDQREAEMTADPSKELSQEQFMARFSERRKA